MTDIYARARTNPRGERSIVPIPTARRRETHRRDKSRHAGDGARPERPTMSRSATVIGIFPGVAHVAAAPIRLGSSVGRAAHS
jgi:hypothetical protein